MSRSRALSLRPTQVLVIAFFAAILVGAALLMTPWAATGDRLGAVDAIFTATSATCVTGLVVVDTGTRLTTFGQGIVLALIQLGGLGIMTFGTTLLVVLGRRLSFRGQEAVQHSLGRGARTSVKRLARNVVVFTAIVELVGAVPLAVVFGRSMPVGRAIYSAVFHSVSAFCNAGFSLFPTSLEGYRGSWLVNLTVVALIIAGGVGFVVVEDLSTTVQDWKAGRGLRLRLHSKVVLVVTGLLVLAGGLGVFVFERHNALAGMSANEAFLACLFQSVTARTAGFSTVDYSELTNATLFLTALLMLVGGSPGSCAGGIKTTTVAVVASLFRDRLLGRSRVRMAHRTVPDSTVAQSVSMLVGTVAFVVVVAFALVAIELGPVPHRTAGGTFLEMLFEVVSAVGTVGLTTGVTPMLSATGKLLLVLAMFVGRLGPLTLVAALARAKQPAKLDYAEEDLLIG